MVNDDRALTGQPVSDGGTERLPERSLANGMVHARAMNDDRSPLLTLMSCIVCKTTMRLERSYPGDDGKDIIQYRCEQCGRIERIGLVRGSWPLSG